MAYELFPRFRSQITSINGNLKALIEKLQAEESPPKPKNTEEKDSEEE